MISSLLFKTLAIAILLSIGINLRIQIKKKGINDMSLILGRGDSNSINNEENQYSDTTPNRRIKLNSKQIEILSLSKEINIKSTDENYEKYKLWSLTADQLKKVFKKFEPMSSEKQYLFFSLPLCRIKGELKINDIKYSYWVGAGSTLTLKKSDTTMYFGCLDKSCKKYFVTGKTSTKHLRE